MVTGIRSSNSSLWSEWSCRTDAENGRDVALGRIVEIAVVLLVSRPDTSRGDSLLFTAARRCMAHRHAFVDMIDDRKSISSKLPGGQRLDNMFYADPETSIRNALFKCIQVLIILFVNGRRKRRHGSDLF